jgi:hypothetical protein
MECVNTAYKSMLEDPESFSLAIHDYTSTQVVTGSSHAKCRRPVSSIAGLLTLIDIVFVMFRDVGLCVVYDLYEAIKHQQTVDFDIADGWNICCFSALPSRQCVSVGPMTVHVQYLKLLQSLWLVTHVHEVESARRASAASAPATPVTRPQLHSELYREAIRFVLQELERLYGHIARQNKEHCARSGT